MTRLDLPTVHEPAQIEGLVRKLNVFFGWASLGMGLVLGALGIEQVVRQPPNWQPLVIGALFCCNAWFVLRSSRVK